MALTHLIRPGDSVDLSKIRPGDDNGLDRESTDARCQSLGEELTDLQELMYAAGKNGLLIVLQGRDTAGKDGTIRHLLKFMNAQGTAIAPFKVPTPKELAHDFLWRVHGVTPGRGETVIFNRSHYEDVLVVRVHDLAPQDVWKKRYDHINAFEQLLVDSDVIVVKFMLHISAEEQERRLMEREADKEKSWKLSVGDWKEREYWDDYAEAYEDALRKCNSPCPWHVVPADKKWYRNLAVTETLVKTLQPYREAWMERLDEIGDRAKAELATYRASKSSS